MPFFGLERYRLINTEEVADIHYMPARDFQGGSEGVGMMHFHEDSKLKIRLRGSDERIELEGDEAEEAWRAFNSANSPEPKEPLS